MTEPSAEVSPIRRRAVMLTKWQRLSASLAGLSAGGAGGAAVFTTDNQAGSTTLLVLSGLGLLLGITGRVPDRIGTDGVNYDPVDPATTAVQRVLSDDNVSLDTRETIAAAVREELDRRQLNSSLNHTRSSSNDRLSAQANAILFESLVRDVLKDALPAGTRFATEVRRNGLRLDGVIESIDNSGSATHKNLIFEVTTSHELGRRLRDVIPRMASLAPDGFVYVANSAQTLEAKHRLKEIFHRRAAEARLPNAHIVFFDEENEMSRLELARVTQLAWEAAIGSDPSRE